MTTSSEEARALQHSDTPARAPGDRHTQLTDGDQHTASASALAGSNDDNAVRAKAFESIGPEEFASIIFGDAFTPDRRLVVSRFGPDGSSAWCSSPEKAAQVVQAIRDDQFWLFTDTLADDMIRRRHADIESRTTPGHRAHLVELMFASGADA